MTDYYKQTQMITKIDRDGRILGEIEKWEAHRKGILHKALTVAIIFEGKFIIQHRKHPAFDGTFDVTSSSHQLFINGRLQTTEEATLDCLKREWGITKEDLKGEISDHGSVYYKAKDPNSEFTEHEVCDVLLVEVTKEPTPDLDFAYGMEIINKEELTNTNTEIYQKLAPWVKVMIEEGKL